MQTILVRCAWPLRAIGKVAILVLWLAALLVALRPEPLVKNSTGSPSLDAAIALFAYLLVVLGPLPGGLLFHNTIRLEGPRLTVYRFFGISSRSYAITDIVSVRPGRVVADILVVTFADGMSVWIHRFATGLPEFFHAVNIELPPTASAV